MTALFSWSRQPGPVQAAGPATVHYVNAGLIDGLVAYFPFDEGAGAEKANFV